MGASRDEPLVVGFLVDRWEPARGGAEAALAALAAHLEARGCDVRAFALRGAPGAPGRFQRVRLGVRRPGRVPHERALGRALVDAARAAGCDVTIGLRHLPEVDLYWPHGGAHRRSVEARDRSRGREPRAKLGGRHAVYLEYEHALLAEGGARRVLCVSELVRAELAELYPACAERLFVVPNGVDLERFHPDRRAREGAALRRALGCDDATPLLAFLGRDPRLKGLPALLAALAGLTELPWHLIVAGPRHAGRWRSRAVRLGLAERVAVEEHLASEDLLAAADLTCVPTWRDTASLVVLESLASGTPVVTTARAGESALIDRPDRGAVLAAPGDEDALRAALRRQLARASDAPARDRLALHAAVADRGHAEWLARLERHVHAVARR